MKRFKTGCFTQGIVKKVTLPCREQHSLLEWPKFQSFRTKKEGEAVVSRQATDQAISRKARLWPEIPHDTVALPAVPASPSASNASTLITVGLSIAGVAVTGFLYSRFAPGGQGGFIVVFIAMSAFAAVGSLATFIIQISNTRRQKRYLRRAYTEKLQEVEKQLVLLQLKERQARIDLDPPFIQLETGSSAYEHLRVVPLIMRSYSEQDIQLWSRRPDDPDFLTVRIGMDNRPATFTTRSEESNTIALPGPFDEMKAQARSLAAGYASLVAPITVKLDEHGPVAIASTPYGLEQARNLAHTLVSQLVYHHSPEDVRVIVLAPKSQEAQWQWATILPHTRVFDVSQPDSSSAATLHEHAVAIGPEEIIEYLPLISRELSRRELLLGDERRPGGAAPLPRLVIVVDHFDASTDLDPPPIAMSVMAFGQQTTGRPGRVRLTIPPLKRAELTLALSRGAHLGVSTVCICASLADIPTTCGLLIDLSEQDTTLSTSLMSHVTKNSRGLVRVLQPDPPPVVPCNMLDSAPYDALRYFATKMQPLRPAITKRPQLRNQVDLRALFDPPLDLASYDPSKYWFDPAFRTSTPSTGAPAQLRIPIGQKIGDEIQYLDFVKDGPHGLLIGQTGSGKSELLQTLITSLAILYRPAEVTFVLIDYKAGLALEPFRHLPHTIGFLSNVSSAALIQRFITMLRAEAVRREIRLKKGEISPRLIIIIDEFAEMARRTESVLDELFTITRVGREIGMHLLLAAQRPEGIIGNKVRDYVQYRLCLRCASPEDSREVLGRTDAANLPASIPGRGFLLHGDNQLDLFQAARATIPPGRGAS